MPDAEPKPFSGSYIQPINYENVVLLPKLRDISLWRDVDMKAYESGVVTLAIFLPKDLRSKALAFFDGNTVKEDLTMDGKKDFDDILVYILTLLEDNGIAFPKSRFETGHG